jgi:3-hydroxyacyl-[acyl-carrier-protein] dehydratase
MPIVPLFIESDHPAFAGHFPGRPIVPGVLLLDRAQRAIESKIGMPLEGLPAAKFHSPATPGEELELEYDIEKSIVHFQIRCRVRRIASGRFLIASSSLT